MNGKVTRQFSCAKTTPLYDEIDRLKAVNKQLLEALNTLTVYADAISRRVELHNIDKNDICCAAVMPELLKAIRQAKAAISAAEGGAEK